MTQNERSKHSKVSDKLRISACCSLDLCPVLSILKYVACEMLYFVSIMNNNGQASFMLGKKTKNMIICDKAYIKILEMYRVTLSLLIVKRFC